MTVVDLLLAALTGGAAIGSAIWLAKHRSLGFHHALADKTSPTSFVTVCSMIAVLVTAIGAIAYWLDDVGILRSLLSVFVIAAYVLAASAALVSLLFGER